MAKLIRGALNALAYVMLNVVALFSFRVGLLQLPQMYSPGEQIQEQGVDSEPKAAQETVRPLSLPNRLTYT